MTTQSLQVQVVNQNEGLAAVRDQFGTIQAEALSVTSPGVLTNDYSIDGHPLSATLVADVTHGVLTLNVDGSFTYVPEPSFFGSDQFTYRVTDGSLTSDPVTVTIVVEGVAPPGGDDDGSHDDAPLPDDGEHEEEPPPDDPLPPELDQDQDDPAADPNLPVARDPSRGAQPGRVSASYGGRTPTEDLLAREGEERSWGLDEVLWRRVATRVSGLTSLDDRFEEAALQTIVSMSMATLSVDFAFLQNNTSDSMSSISTEELVLGSVAVTSTALSVGYVVWLIRGGSLFASLLASLPAWVSFDPLPIIESSEESDEANEHPERLQDLVKESKSEGV